MHRSSSKLKCEHCHKGLNPVKHYKCELCKMHVHKECHQLTKPCEKGADAGAGYDSTSVDYVVSEKLRRWKCVRMRVSVRVCACVWIGCPLVSAYCGFDLFFEQIHAFS